MPAYFLYFQSYFSVAVVRPILNLIIEAFSSCLIDFVKVTTFMVSFPKKFAVGFLNKAMFLFSNNISFYALIIFFILLRLKKSFSENVKVLFLLLLNQPTPISFKFIYLFIYLFFY